MRTFESLPEETTGITSVATKALLEGLVSDVRALRQETAETHGTALRIDERQRDLAKHLLEQDHRLSSIEKQVSSHLTDDAVKALKQENSLSEIKAQMSLVSPLVSQHERLIQQAHGAVVATKMLYTLFGIVSGGGVTALIQLLTKGH